MKIEGLIERMRRLPEIDDQGYALDDQKIREIENRLDIILPADFKILLRNFGSFLSPHITFICFHPEFPDIGIVTDTEYNRAELERAHKSTRRNRETLIRWAKRWPQKAIVVENCGNGSFYVLYSQDSNRPGQVAYLDHILEWREDETWPSFPAYLEERIECAENEAKENG